MFPARGVELQSAYVNGVASGERPTCKENLNGALKYKSRPFKIGLEFVQLWTVLLAEVSVSRVRLTIPG